MSCLELDDTAIVKIAEPMMDDIMVGLARRDYSAHSQQFSVDLKSALTAERFAENGERYEREWGQPTTRELVAVFRKPKSFTLVWNQRFNRFDGDVLALATIALKGGRYFIDEFELH